MNKILHVSLTTILGFCLAWMTSNPAHAYRLILIDDGPGTYSAGDRVPLGSGTTVHWEQRSIEFSTHVNGAGDGLTFEQTRGAMEAAYDAWQHVACASVSFRSTGATTATRNATDGLNTTYWAEAGAPEFDGPNAILSPGVLAVTIITIQTHQALSDVDIAFNGRDFNWALSDSPIARDIQDTATHEIGHGLGFHHTELNQAPLPTMYFLDQGNNAGRTLEADDRNALCLIYGRLSGDGLAVGDFDGDGRADLAVGVPNESIGSLLGVGIVNVLYGANGGLNSTGDQSWHQGSSGIFGTLESNDHFGSAVAVGDFDNDGFDDLAIGVRNEAIGSRAGAGAVNVLYGSGSGLTATGNQMWHQNIGGVLGVAEAFDGFGTTLTTGDFDGDGFADLAVGVPNEEISSLKGAGAVNVLYGGPSGLTPNGDQIWHQRQAGVLEDIAQHDHFGAALAAGDFDNDGFTDLAIGAPREDVGTARDAGAVNVLYGGSAGLTASGDQLWHQNRAGIGGVSESLDQLGSSLAVGDFDNDGYSDLAMGVPVESIGSRDGAGAVNVLYGTATGLAANGDQIWQQNSPGVKGLAEPHDYFGSALVSCDFDRDGRDDLAIGVPMEGVGSIPAAGAVNVLFGTSSGLSGADDQIWDQNRGSVIGLAEEGDHFGASLACGNFRGGNWMDLAIGVPRESIIGVEGAGAVGVLRGTSGGLTGNGDQSWHQNRSGVNDISQPNDGFGGGG